MAGHSSPVTANDDSIRKINPSTRSFTTPARFNQEAAKKAEPEIGAAAAIETLFVAPSATIIRFETPVSQARPNSNEPGDLPWTSFSERTMATGHLELYRVPGSASFLRSGLFLHHILRRSLCWCVDGVSKFVLRVRQNTYYRVELPAQSPEDLTIAETFKTVLGQVCYYEREPCPFARTFTVDLPQSPPKVRKSRRSDTGPVKKWKLQRANKWHREGEEYDDEGTETAQGRSSSENAERAEGDDTTVSSEDEDISSDLEAGDGATAPRAAFTTAILTTPTKPGRLATPEAQTASPKSSTVLSPPSKLRPEAYQIGGTVTTDHSSSNVSFPNPLDPTRLQTFQNIPTDMPPSPPDSSAGIDWSEQTPTKVASVQLPEHARGETHEHIAVTNQVPDAKSATTVSTPTTSRLEAHASNDDASHIPESITTPEPLPSTPQRNAATVSATVPSDYQYRSPTRNYHGSPEIEDQFAQIQARIRARRSIGGSGATTPSGPLRDTKSLAIRPRQSNSIRQQAFGTALVKKACHVFLGPPAALVALMLHIARRFSNGALDMATTFVFRDRPLRIPGSFHTETSDEAGEQSHSQSDVLHPDLNLSDEDDLEEWNDELDGDVSSELRDPLRIASESVATGHGQLQTRISREMIEDG